MCRLWHSLFYSGAKFNSHCGWPSFDAPATDENITYLKDTSHGMIRIEIVCSNCGGHLGHVLTMAQQIPDCAIVSILLRSFSRRRKIDQSALRRVKAKVEPSFGVLLTVMVWLCASITCLTILNPRPVPPKSLLRLFFHPEKSLKYQA